MPLILRQKLDHLAPGDSVDRGVNFLLLDDLGYLPQGPRSPRCSSPSSPNATSGGPWASPPTWSTRSGNAFANPMAIDAAIDRGGPPHHYPRVRRPQLPHRCGPAAGSGTEGESQSPVNRHPPTPYSSGGPRSIQERGSPSALRRDSSARRRAPSLIASFQGESFEALNAHLERRCLPRMDARLRGHSESIGQRMERDLEALLPPPAAARPACLSQAGRVSSLSLVRYP